MGVLLNSDTTLAYSAMWFTTRDNGFPVEAESADQFARGQLVGMAVCTAFITMLFFLRFTVKYMSGTKMLLDDWTCIVAWLSIMIYATTAFIMIHYGLGHHISELSESNTIEMNKWLYASSVVYNPATYVTKVTLLLLVARVFAVMEKVVKSIYIFIIALFVAYLPIQLAKICSCMPISSYWDPSIPGTCIDARKLFVSDLSLAILTDLTILILPIPLTWSLSFSWKKKVKIGVLLGAGGAAVAVTSYRMYLVIQFLGSKDATYDFAWLALLTLLEMALGLTCACLPTVNVLVDRLLRRNTNSASERCHQQPNIARTRSSQLPPHRRREPSEMSKLWTTITGKTYANSTTRTGERCTFDTTTSAAHHHHRQFGSFISAKLKWETHNEHNITSSLPVHIQDTEQAVPHDNDEAWSNSSQRGGTTPYVGGTATPPQHEPECPDFDVEMQMSSGRPVLLSDNHEKVSIRVPECLRLVDAERGRREGWLAPAAQVALTEETMATARNAMAYNAQWFQTLRDTTGHDGAGPRRDWIWDGTWRG